ncbi:MAG TPA: hypothetical protein VMU53_07915 [Candidatus Sulfotelmatobacter sp.]|nr:hypothetical protein [Candidatus Sulfotelmatobacter sp.]
MARSKSSSSNIYSQHDHRDAIDIADRGVRGEFVHPSDAFGIVPSTLGLGNEVEFKSLTKNTGSPMRRRGMTITCR